MRLPPGAGDYVVELVGSDANLAHWWPTPGLTITIYLSIDRSCLARAV